MFTLKTISGISLYTDNAKTAADAVRSAIRDEVNLCFACFDGLDLSDVNFCGTMLGHATFRGAILRRTNFTGCSLRRAIFDDADCTEAVFTHAAFTDLTYWNGAIMRGACITGTDPWSLSHAQVLDQVDLLPLRGDLGRILDAAPAEVSQLLELLREGRIDGTMYTGACCCLLGSIARIRGDHYLELPDLPPNSASPAESFVQGIRRKTPKTNQAAEILEKEILHWMARRAVDAVASISQNIGEPQEVSLTAKTPSAEALEDARWALRRYVGEVETALGADISPNIAKRLDHLREVITFLTPFLPARRATNTEDSTDE